MATFGDTTQGGGTYPCTGDRALLSKFTAPENGTITDISAAFNSTGANFKGLVYSDVAGEPSALLGVGAATACINGYATSTGLSVAITNGTDYWLGSVVDSFAPSWTYDAATNVFRQWSSCTYASPPATWSTDDSGTVQTNVYATYTPAAGGVSKLMLLGVS